MQARAVQQFTKDNVFIVQYETISQASKSTGVTHITDVIMGKRKFAGGFIWKYADDNDKKARTNIHRERLSVSLQSFYALKKINGEVPSYAHAVNQYTKGGIFVASFKSVSEAGKTTGACHITDAALGKRKFAGGFIWRYQGDNLPTIRRVEQYTKENVLINVFSSLSEAIEKTNICHIETGCSGIWRTVGGFIWKYEKDVEKVV